MKKIKRVKAKHRIENLILRILIIVAAVLLAGTIGGLIFYGYLLFKFGL